jgi:hypothetical protein
MNTCPDCLKKETENDKLKLALAEEKSKTLKARQEARKYERLLGTIPLPSRLPRIAW